MNEIKPDITISTGMRVMNYLYEVNDGSKKVLELHFSKYKRKFMLSRFENSVFGRMFLNLYYYKRNQIVKKYDRFLVLTEEDKNSWLVSDIKNMEVIANPLPFIPEVCSDLKAKRIIAAGRYTYQKGFDILLDIWSRVEGKYPEWTLTIFGAGAKKNKLEQKIKKLNLSERIELYPAVPDISAEFMNSSIFALPSRYEGLPMVLIEAMVCGVPPVCFACKCGPRDVIKNGENGFFVDMGDSDEFINRLTQLMDDEELRHNMGQSAHQSIRILDKEIIMPKWISLFDSLKNSNN